MGTDSTDSTSDDNTDDKVEDKTVDPKDAKSGTDSKSKTDSDDSSALKKALQAERKRADAAEKTLRDGELAKLPELERAKSVAEELTKENERLTKENMRLTIAMDLGLPWKLGKRLSGDTEEEMRADGADLLKDYKVDDSKRVPDDKANKRPPNDAKKQGGSAKPDMNALLRAAAGRG